MDAPDSTNDAVMRSGMEGLIAAMKDRRPAPERSEPEPERSEPGIVVEEPPELSPGAIVGRYVVIKKLGAGAMGVVYAAFDPELDRKVAIKLLRPGHGDSQGRERLLREAQALAKLSHPNVVSIHDVGTVGEQVWLAMELVEGQTLRQWLTAPRSWREVVEVMHRAGEGLAAAHAAELLHRDFKPDNVMLGDDGRVRVMDFGLARVQAGAMSQTTADELSPTLDALSLAVTRAGAVLGTPGYIAAEQFDGKDLTPAADQFAFCVSAWEAFYGERPFAGKTWMELLSNVMFGRRRPPPKGHGSGVPEPIVEVIVRGLSPKAEERWPSMEALLKELQRLAAPREWRKVAGVGVVVAALAGVVAIQQGIESVQAKLDLAAKAQELERELEQNQRLNGELGERRRELERELAAQMGLRALSLAEDAGHELEAVAVAVAAFDGFEAGAGVPGPVMEGLAHGLAEIDRGIALRGHEGKVVAVAVSSDGQHVATASKDTTVRLWNARSGALLRTLEGHEGPVQAVAFSPDGVRVATASEDGTVRLWDLVTAQQLELLGHQGPVRSVAFSPDGTRIATASGDAAWVWHEGPDALVVPLTGHTGRVRSVAFSPDGNEVVTASEDHTARVWSIQTGAASRALEGHTDRVFDVVVSPDGTRIATAGRDETARLWDAASGRLLDTLEHGEVVYGVAFSPDGTKLATGTFDDGVARVWDVATLERLALVRHEDAVVDVAFSPGGDQLVTASWDFTARSWSLEPQRALLGLPHPRRVDAVAFSPDGTRVVTGSGDGSARLWDARSGAHLATLHGHRIDVLAVAFSPDGSSVATASWDGSVRLWDASSGEHRTTLHGHTEPVSAVAFASNGTQVATASRDGTARVWDAATGAEQRSLSHGAAVVDVVLDPQGQRLVTVGADDRARVWSTTTGEALLGLLPEERVTAVAFSPDGRRLAVASKDGAVNVVDVPSGEALARAWGHTAAVRTMSFSHDGTRLATAGDDGTARVWALGEQEPRFAFPHAGPVTSVAFSPEGMRLATASGDHEARLWSLEAGSWVEWGCATLDGRSAHREATVRVCANEAAAVTTGEGIVEPRAQMGALGLVEPEVMTANDLDVPEVITVHGVELVLIPGGTFTMGSPPGERGRFDHEGPQHEVTLDGFYLERAPVTNAQYAVYLEANPEAAKHPEWEDEQYNQPDQPVLTLNWYQAKAYCEWAGLSLPTEAQWEYAARAGTRTAYWFGDAANDLERFDWHDVNSGAMKRGFADGRPRSVATKGANPWAMFDLHGNVNQWMLDGYAFYTTNVRAGDGLRREPVGDLPRVVRGGSFGDDARYTRLAYRYNRDPDDHQLDVTLRPALGLHR